MDWAEFLRIMVAEEQSAEAKYRFAANSTDDPKLKEVFEQLVYEESLHAALLEKWYNDAKKKQAAS